MNDSRGSLWRKWDLHLHTPCSLVQNYGGDTKKNWNKFINELENLPNEIKVLGINDYIFIDGYKKILKIKKEGRLPNIELILPVIELRLDKFGGTDSKLSRVNFHILFSNAIEVETIEQQFLNALPAAYQLTPEYEFLKSEWSGVATRESLIDLGKRIINSVPDNERKKFGPPIKEGFSNLNFNLDDIYNRLNTSYFRGKFITAVGKTEWWDINWNDKSIADKKNIINKADLVFISAESPKDYYRAKNSLTDSRVNNRLLDCSDAHNYSESKEKDRIGKCFTWVKGDPTFEGLKLVLVEPDERIFIGEKPESLKVVEKNPTKYIKSIRINKKSKSSLKEKWFETEIEFNHGLVAIIGNKGSGKSALTDVIGLLGNSRNQESFSFLNSDKFRKQPQNKAQHFEARLYWESEKVDHGFLDDEIDSIEVEKVKYLPQNYFERVCTELGKIEESAFDKEIKEVIYSHVDKANRLDQPSLDELIKYKSSEIHKALTKARSSIKNINEKIVDLETKLYPHYREKMANQLKVKKAELDAHEKNKPLELKKPEKIDSAISNSIDECEKERARLLTEIEGRSEQLEEVTKSIASIELLLTKIENFKTEFEEFRSDFEESASGLDINFEDVITLEIDTLKIEQKFSSLQLEELDLKESLDKRSKEGLYKKVQSVGTQLEALQEKLDQPNKEYQQYTEDLKEWTDKRNEVIGDENEVGSLSYLQDQILRIEEIPNELKERYDQRLSKSRGIYRKIKQQRNILATLYSPIQEFFKSHEDISEKLDLQFDVSIVNAGFQENFFEWISRSVSGSFMGIIKGKKILDDLISKHDFNNEMSTLEFLQIVIEHLTKNINDEDEPEMEVINQLKTRKTVESLYDYIFSLEYLEPRYTLKLGEKDIRQLSPGERGALLIIFYLLIDRDNKPLIIDQPEHNLDNETVTNLLVPAIRKAKNRRQVILITHNPILAVVCNADQIICASLDIENDHQISYETGAIENQKINRRIVDVLEGTMFAFSNRQMKYLKEFFTTYPFYREKWGFE